ncbi:hypothetical protein BAU07_26390 (plasmid) [Bordetella flabilis]|uniref:DUF7673 domain-containing protein n=1 Tax=Bordetella flabilis TaxID=463014 RepID=A0A193GN30_9BORD|nr:hypothetical protein BAU07_26390 [Bordetella flabilis]
MRAAYDETPPTEEERTALLRLVKHAQGNTGQSRRVADFLLAWWDAGRCGGFDMTNLWGIDRAIARDIVTVFGLIARLAKYPDHIDQALEAEFQAISKTWGPDA